MKKKKIIVAVLVILILGITAVLGWKLYDAGQESVEEPFEIDALEMYGAAEYLGPMEEEVTLLTEEEIKELNPIREPYMVYDEKSDRTRIYGRFNTSKIEDIYDAREAVSRILQYVGYTCDEQTLMYGNTTTTMQGNDVYEYAYFYKGVKCMGRYVGIWVDEEGDCIGGWFDGSVEKKVTLESVVPVYRGEKLQALLDERYGECEIRHKTLWICMFGEEYGMKWRIEIDAEKSPVRVLWMNANTGEIWGEDSMTDVY